MTRKREGPASADNGYRPCGGSNEGPHRIADPEQNQRTKSRPLAEPIECAKFFKNRKGDWICITLKDFEGRTIVDVRQFYTGKDGRALPTRKGIAMSVRRLPDLAAAINSAMAKACALGLITDGTEQ